jgi:hypothetical protein
MEEEKHHVTSPMARSLAGALWRLHVVEIFQAFMESEGSDLDHKSPTTFLQPL